MLHFSKAELNRQANALGFVRDTFEKICRLADVLGFMENNKKPQKVFKIGIAFTI
ncbi:MAG TPA: hypothetical protein P5064_00665 [Clostridia bacterium]|jgi:hypothetical protein|nr:hypothetical protein [Clostridiaceae bacterium]HOF26819.1 hypothetical protein [Clostridia bacterium]HOM33884.1 hypothetical protein [Clostridia bacterium]HOR89858.1 hypothetical protein [Clostridia bacterium]HOT69958.1 hypothetical protein [Clostridia bacterium]